MLTREDDKVSQCYQLFHLIVLFQDKGVHIGYHDAFLTWVNMFDDKFFMLTNVRKCATSNTHVKCQARQGITHLKF